MLLRLVNTNISFSLILKKLKKAGERPRTPDRLITSQLLYQLSYASVITSFNQASCSTSTTLRVVRSRHALWRKLSYASKNAVTISKFDNSVKIQ